MKTSRVTFGTFTWGDDGKGPRIERISHFEINGPTSVSLSLPTGAYEYDVSGDADLCTARGYFAVLTAHTMHLQIAMFQGIGDPLNTGFAVGEVRDAVPLAGVLLDAPVQCGAPPSQSPRELPLHVEDGAYYVAAGVFGNPLQPALRLGSGNSVRFIPLRIPDPASADGMNINALASVFAHPAKTVVCL